MAEDDDEFDLSEDADFSDVEPPKDNDPDAPIKVVVDDLHIVYRVWTAPDEPRNAREMEPSPHCNADMGSHSCKHRRPAGARPVRRASAQKARRKDCRPKSG